MNRVRAQSLGDKSLERLPERPRSGRACGLPANAGQMAGAPQARRQCERPTAIANRPSRSASAAREAKPHSAALAC